MVSFKGAHVPQEIILMGVRGDVACPSSYQHGEELLEERDAAGRCCASSLAHLAGEQGVQP
jgi:hypothetical protein